jgi:hypothetical protein
MIRGSLFSHFLIKSYHLKHHLLETQLDSSVGLSWQCHIDIIRSPDPYVTPPPLRLSEMYWALRRS